MSVVNLLRTAASFPLGCFFGFLVAVKILWIIIWNPRKAFYVKDRTLPPACMNDPSLGTHHYIQLEDVKLHYVASGEEGNPLMLFVHGFPEFWYSWRYQIREFSKDYRVIAIDQRGYNDSDKPSGIKNYRVSILENDLKQLIYLLGYKSCVLVGHDWGGVVCWLFAAVNQRMVDKLIIMNIGHPAAFMKYLMKNKTQFLKSWYIYFFQLPWLPEFAARLMDYQMIENCFAGKVMGVKSGVFPKVDVEAYKFAISKPGAATGAINYYRAANIYPDKSSKIIESPTLIIWGCQDHALEAGLAEASREFTKYLTINYIEEASHWVQIDEPQKVNKFMREFLNKKHHR